MKRRVFVQAAAIVPIATPWTLRADDKQPIKILVGFTAGGSSDVAARLIAEIMGNDLGRPVVVDNKPGAAGRIAADVLKNATPDGTTLMLCPIVVPILAPMTFSKLSYNPATDLAPIVQVGTLGFGLAVKADHPARNVQELMTWFKANPAQGNFGTPGPGSLPHFFGVMVGRAAKVDLVHVPFNGSANAATALMGGQTSCTFDTITDLLPHHRGGRLRILATAGEKRNPLLSDVSTFIEQGLPEVQGSSWYAIYAPGRTPDATLRSLNAAINKALLNPGLREKFANLGLEPTGGSIDDLVAISRRDTERWGPVVKASGFRGD